MEIFSPVKHISSSKQRIDLRATRFVCKKNKMQRRRKGTKGQRQPSAAVVDVPVIKPDASTSSYLVLVVLVLLMMVVTAVYLYASSSNVVGGLPPKYHSSLVTLHVQRLLKPECLGKEFQVISDEPVSITKIETSVEGLRARNWVFVMLNGQNEGKLLEWHAASSCLFEFAHTAALALHADANWLQNGVKLMSQFGQPIRTSEELDRTRIVHVLLDYQLWVWPGIQIGHQYQLLEGFCQ